MRLDDRDIVTDCLMGTKLSSSSFHHAVLEASNDSIRNTFLRMHNDSLMMNKTLFDLMRQRGWYQVEPATAVQPMIQQQVPYHTATTYQAGMQFQSPSPGQTGF